MQALRLFAEPKGHQLIIDLPPELNTGRLEVIVMPAFETSTVKAMVATTNLLGSAVFSDDLISPACPESDWDALK